MKIEVTSTEIDNRQLTTEHLSQTLQSIQKDGFVILGRVIPTHLLDMLFERMMVEVF